MAIQHLWEKMLSAFDHAQCTVCMPASNIQFTLPFLNSTCHQLMIHIFRSSCDPKKSTGRLEGGKTHGATPARFPGMVLPLEPAVNFQQGFGGSKFQLRVWLKRKNPPPSDGNPVEFSESDDFFQFFHWFLNDGDKQYTL